MQKRQIFVGPFDGSARHYISHLSCTLARGFLLGVYTFSRRMLDRDSKSTIQPGKSIQPKYI